MNTDKQIESARDDELLNSLKGTRISITECMGDINKLLETHDKIVNELRSRIGGPEWKARKGYPSASVLEGFEPPDVNALYFTDDSRRSFEGFKRVSPNRLRPVRHKVEMYLRLHSHLQEGLTYEEAAYRLVGDGYPLYSKKRISSDYTSFVRACKEVEKIDEKDV